MRYQESIHIDDDGVVILRQYSFLSPEDMLVKALKDAGVIPDLTEETRKSMIEVEVADGQF